MLCVFYVLALAGCLSIAGILFEYSLPPTASRRWVWSAMIATSVLLPSLSASLHAAPVIELFGYPLAELQASEIASASTPWWDSTWLTHHALFANVVAPLWAGSVAALLLWGVANALWLRRATRASAQGSSGDAGVVDGIQATVTNSIGPTTVGLRKVHVVVPRWVLALPRSRRRYVLHHEDEHRRAHDARLLAVASIMVSLVPWILPLWWQLRRLQLAVEMDCDRRVVSRLGDPRAYAETLLTIAQAAPGNLSVQPALLGRRGMLERRLKALLVADQPSRARQLAAFAGGCALLIMALTAPHPVRPGHAHAGGVTPSHAASHASR